MGRLKRKRSVSKKKRRKKVTGDNQKVLSQKNKAHSITTSQRVEDKDSSLLGKGSNKVVSVVQGFSQPEFWLKTKQFIREVKIELKKVTWPTRQDTLVSTIVVLILVIIISAFLGIVDVGLSSLVHLILE